MTDLAALKQKMASLDFEELSYVVMELKNVTYILYQ